MMSSSVNKQQGTVAHDSGKQRDSLHLAHRDGMDSQFDAISVLDCTVHVWRPSKSKVRPKDPSSGKWAPSPDQARPPSKGVRA